MNACRNLPILFLNVFTDYRRRLLADPGKQWMLLAGLQALFSIWLVHATQRVPSITLLTVVVWGGAVICIEDHLDGFKIRPSGMSLMVGAVLLAYATWRCSIVLDRDTTVYGLALVQGLALALLARPIRQLWIFRGSLIVLSLLPLQLVVSKLLPEYWLSVATGRASQVLLLIFGVNASLSGRVLNLGQGAVQIAAACNGVDLIVQVTVIAIVFTLAFPVRSVALKLLYVGSAPVIGYLVNGVRIALLAVISSSSLPWRQGLFDFMHEEWGGLVFAGLATLLIGQIYMVLIERQLEQRHG